MPRPGSGPNNFEKSKDFKGSMIRLIKNLYLWKYIMLFSLILAMVSAILALVAPNKLSKFADLIGEGLVPNVEVIEKIAYKMKENSVLKDIEVDGVIISVNDQVELMKLYNNVSKDTDMSNLYLLIDKLPDSVYQLVKPKMDLMAIRDLAIFMGILYLASSLFSYIQGYLLTGVSNRFANKLRGDISKKINKLPLKYFDTHENGDILSRVTNDVDTIAFNLNNSLATLVTSLTMFLGSLFMMSITNWVMAIVAVGSCLIGLMFLSLILKKSQKYFIAKQEALGELNGYIEEMYSGHNVVKVYNGTKSSFVEFNRLNNQLYETNRKSQFLSSLMHPIMGFVGNLGYVAVCIVGALLAMKGMISFGVIVAFMIYIRMFNNPLNQMAQALGSLQSTAAASERVFEFLNEKELSSQENISRHLNKTAVKGEIEFKNVKFGYNPGRVIIKDFSVKIKPGQKIAIVGPTGAGKTTMVNLLMKFYEINSGQIIIDSHDINELTRENVHDLFIMVLQDTWLFEGSIRDNIKFTRKDVSDRDIWEALKTVGISHFVNTLPGGLDYVVGDNDTISQGQKQLLTIARGMIVDAPFLILDEATSNVDTRTEELVQKAMDKLTEGRTSFIIAHRLSTIKNADLILVMNDGNIIEQGNHNELIAKKGFYASLYNSQFESVKE